MVYAQDCSWRTTGALEAFCIQMGASVAHLHADEMMARKNDGKITEAKSMITKHPIIINLSLLLEMRR